jgi:hypothetical protein
VDDVVLSALAEEEEEEGKEGEGRGAPEVSSDSPAPPVFMAA